MSQVPSCCESILGVTVESVHGKEAYLVWTGILGSSAMLARPLEFLLSFKFRPPPLEVRHERQDTLPKKQGNGPSSRDEEGKAGLLLSCGRTVGVPLEWRRVCRGISCIASSVSRTLLRLKREGGFLSRHHNRKWLHLALRRKSPGFSQVASGNLGFFLSTTRTTGYRSCGLWEVQSPCEL